MKDNHLLRAKNLYSTNLRKFSNWLFCYFILAVGIPLTTVTYWATKFGSLFYFAVPIFLVCFVSPPLVLRGAKHYSKRVFFLLSGLLLCSLLGITKLGLPSVGWLILLAMPIIAVALLGRRGAQVVLGLVLLVPIITGYLFVTGTLETQISDLDSHSKDWRSWAAIFSVLLLCGYACITLAETLRGQWEKTTIEVYKQHDQMQALVEYAPEAIMIFDMSQGKFTTVNARAERLFGYSREELVETLNPWELSPEYQADGRLSSTAISSYLQQALEGEFPIFEWLHTDRTGAPLVCEISLARLPPFDQQLIRASVVEISKRKNDANEHEAVLSQLAASQKLEAVGKLTGGVAHDFNNILAVTLGNLELLRDDINDPEHCKLIDSSIAATLRGADLTRNMLAFARKASLEPARVDINKVVLETKNWISRTLPATISVETSLLAGLWPVEADQSATESALLNLILNARDAMPSGGKLTIETANIRIDEAYVDARQEELQPGRYVMLAVSDTGQGIPPGNIVEIFEPFFSTKETNSNSGLGLSMVHGFMRQSEGTVQVYSEPGIGTTFKLYFKVSTNVTNADPVQTVAISRDSSGRRILLAEDESGVLDLLVNTLEKAGYNVTAAHSGDAAKLIFDADPNYDLLVTDIVMPGTLQGTTLSQALREKAPNLPVIFMSGYAREATVHGNGLRPDDIRLMKPVRRVDLLAAIKKSLQANAP